MAFYPGTLQVFWPLVSGWTGGLGTASDCVLWNPRTIHVTAPLAGLKLNSAPTPTAAETLWQWLLQTQISLYSPGLWPNAASLGPSQSLHQVTEDVAHLGLRACQDKKIGGCSNAMEGCQSLRGVPEGRSCVDTSLATLRPYSHGDSGPEVTPLSKLDQVSLIWTMTNKGLNRLGRWVET